MGVSQQLFEESTVDVAAAGTYDFSLRIRPDEGSIELQSGVSQFGRNRDDWGHWFGCDNSHPMFQFILDEQISYPEEEPWIRQKFEEELARRGLTSDIPEEAYRRIGKEKGK